jgi:hypothetical protein
MMMCRQRKMASPVRRVAEASTSRSGAKGRTGAGVRLLGGSGDPKVVIDPVVVLPCGLVKE